MSERDWLKALKVGDTVIVTRDGFYGSTSISTVLRFTANFIIVKEPNGSENKFRKESGWEPGPGSHHASLKEATPEALAELRERIYRANFLNKLEHLKWDDVPLDRIKEIREIVEPYVGQHKEK